MWIKKIEVKYILALKGLDDTNMWKISRPFLLYKITKSEKKTVIKQGEVSNSSQQQVASYSKINF